MKKLVVIAVAGLLVGCSLQNWGYRDLETKMWHKNKVEVKVNSYANEDVMLLDKRVLLLSTDTITPAWDLRRIDYDKMIGRMLSAKGYTFVQNEEDASLVVIYDVGISDPQTYNYNVDVPLYGDTGVKRSTTTTSKNSEGEIVTETSYTNDRGIVGYRTEIHTSTTYVRWLNLVAYDCKARSETGEDRMAWLVECTSVGTNGDLRSMVPFMLFAAQRYVGLNSYREVTVPLGDDPTDVRVQNLRGY